MMISDTNMYRPNVLIELGIINENCNVTQPEDNAEITNWITVCTFRL